MILIWSAEGERELSDHRSTYDWTKYNVRAYSTNYSKKKAKVRNEQGKELQKDLDNAKVSFETNPTDSNGNLLNTKRNQKCSMKKKSRVSLFERRLDGMNTVKQEVFP